MAMPTRETAVTTIEELLALPHDGKRHELLDGVHVVTPAPEYPHQGVLGEFSLALGKALEGQDELRLLNSPADIVLSPSTAARDRGAKRRIYQGAGVAEYWIVDLDARLVERWRPGDARPEVVSEELVWEPLPAIAARLHLPTLFARVLGTA
jgi:Uma2 family endonuclease